MSTPFHPSRTDRLAVALAALGVFLLFLQGPGLGDDFQYWWMAADLHLRGAEAWNPVGFHFLRWPVWGVAWLLQGILGLGAASYYGVPLFYVVCGGLLAFALGARVFTNRAAAWGCALAWLLHPLLNDVIYRPMPDLSEGIFIGAAVLCWMALAEKEAARERLPWAVAAGAVAALLFANRLTGVFVFPVLAAVAAVLSWRNPRFPLRSAALWLAVAGVTWIALVSLEGLLYYRLCGDFFHSVTANLGARGRKGTDSVNLLLLPFRFFGTLWTGGLMNALFTLASLLGGVLLWRSGEREKRAMVAWAVVLYLCYNCALQSVFPPRPLLRTADRFLCSLALPLALLAWEGARWLWTRWPAGLAWSRRRPVLAGGAAFALIALIGGRDFFDRGYLPGLREALRETPPGTRVFTHDTMRFAALLADADAAERLQWTTSKNIFRMEEALEKQAAEAEAFWYCRKHVWFSTQKRQQMNASEKEVRMASYLEKPYPVWMLRRVVLHEESPDFVFYQKRPQGGANVERVALGELDAKAPAFPLRWKHGQTPRASYRMPLPERLRGRLVRLEIGGKADISDNVFVKLWFCRGGKRFARREFQPFLLQKRGVDFHALEIPAEADSCEVEIRILPKTKSVELDGVWLVAEPAQALDVPRAAAR